MTSLRNSDFQLQSCCTGALEYQPKIRRPQCYLRIKKLEVRKRRRLRTPLPVVVTLPAPHLNKHGERISGQNTHEYVQKTYWHYIELSQMHYYGCITKCKNTHSTLQYTGTATHVKPTWDSRIGTAKKLKLMYPYLLTESNRIAVSASTLRDHVSDGTRLEASTADSGYLFPQADDRLRRFLGIRPNRNAVWCCCLPQLFTVV